MKPNFNHAMVYVTDVARSVEFYAGKLGFKVIEQEPVYARLRSPRSRTTLALHKAGGPGETGIRLYFEVPQVRGYCKELDNGGVPLDQPPRKMPWGWEHAYLRDPDGHQISIYRAGGKRLRPTRPAGGRKAKAIGSLKGKIRVRGNILSTGSKWDAES